jgi:hypothetical protein
LLAAAHTPESMPEAAATTVRQAATLATGRWAPDPRGSLRLWPKRRPAYESIERKAVLHFFVPLTKRKSFACLNFHLGAAESSFCAVWRRISPRGCRSALARNCPRSAQNCEKGGSQNFRRHICATWLSLWRAHGSRPIFVSPTDWLRTRLYGRSGGPWSEKADQRAARSVVPRNIWVIDLIAPYGGAD